MLTYDQTIIILFIESLLYSLIAAITLFKGDTRERHELSLILFIVFSGVWTLAEIAWRVGWLNFLGDAGLYILRQVPLYGILLLSILLLYVSRYFMRLPEMSRRWWGFGALWAGLVFVIDSNVLGLPDVLWRTGTFSLNRQTVLVPIVLALGWAIIVAGIVRLIAGTYFKLDQPLHKNRIKYWGLALGLVVLGDLLFLTGFGLWGTIPHMLGVLIAAYATLFHDLPDVSYLLRRGVGYLFITLAIAIAYTAGFVVLQTVFLTVLAYQSMLAGVLSALILGALFQPFVAMLQYVVRRILFGKQYDMSRTLSEYSTYISNILELDHLASVVENLVNETMNVDRSALFVVRQEKMEGNLVYFRLDNPANPKDGVAARGVFEADSPVAEFLTNEYRPLTQYDIDLLPRFQKISERERHWLNELGMAVYVPVYAQGAWIGLLMLGSKLSGDRYYKNDLVLLGTLADQTAVALENARLVEDLRDLNEELTLANGQLEKTYRQLKEMDKLKSGFIGVITHELRTPFANIGFSLEILDRHGRKHLPPELEGQFDQLQAGVKSAKTMIDNLVTFAAFLSKQGELKLTAVDMKQVVEDNLLVLTPLAETKSLALHTEIPESLPRLRADHDRLADAVYHLIHNAIKFTADGGEIRIRCRATTEHLTFEVEDTGIGIAPETLPGLWEGFAQLADPLRRGVEGLGLGLTLVKYVVGAHNGDVYAKSIPDVGSTFGFTLPLALR